MADRYDAFVKRHIRDRSRESLALELGTVYFALQEYCREENVDAVCDNVCDNGNLGSAVHRLMKSLGHETPTQSRRSGKRRVA